MTTVIKNNIKMKKILFTVLILTTISCRAQLTIYNIDTPPTERTVTDNYYYKDINNHHDAVVGIWRWENGNNSFELTLQEFEQYSDPLSPNIYSDDIYGKYTYIENGQTIVNIQEIGTFTSLKFSLGFVNPTEYNVVIKDPVSDTNKVGTFEITSPTTAVMKLWNSEGVKINYGNGQPWSLPTYFELTKI